MGLCDRGLFLALLFNCFHSVWACAGGETGASFVDFSDSIAML